MYSRHHFGYANYVSTSNIFPKEPTFSLILFVAPLALCALFDLQTNGYYLSLTEFQ